MFSTNSAFWFNNFTKHLSYLTICYSLFLFPTVDISEESTLLPLTRNRMSGLSFMLIPFKWLHSLTIFSDDLILAVLHYIVSFDVSLSLVRWCCHAYCGHQDELLNGRQGPLQHNTPRFTLHVFEALMKSLNGHSKCSPRYGTWICFVSCCVWWGCQLKSTKIPVGAVFVILLLYIMNRNYSRSPRIKLALFRTTLSVFLSCNPIVQVCIDNVCLFRRCHSALSCHWWHALWKFNWKRNLSVLWSIFIRRDPMWHAAKYYYWKVRFFFEEMFSKGQRRHHEC